MNNDDFVIRRARVVGVVRTRRRQENRLAVLVFAKRSTRGVDADL